MKKTVSALLLLGAISGPAQAQETATGCGTIRVTVGNLRNTQGLVGVALFDTKKGFPDKPDKALEGRSVTAGEQCVVVFTNVPYGTYAVSALHDENGNGKMDKTFIGIPREGFGTSNNPKIRRGPPSFTESAFNLENGELALKIDMNYF
ncbi:MAG: DUF2141 domain-containing protein [Chlorobiaceae bacterium]|nr:DUF2141 domain-containing protein [Chlorobiaceae bacterium]